jgi:outer membrane receptor for ferrienterochelin and colicins
MTFRTLYLGCSCVVALSLCPLSAWATNAPAGGSTTSNTSGSVATVIVTARRLDRARDTIQPQTGASTYAITSAAIQALPGGDNTELNQVVLQAPGVAQDSFGQLHIRGEHNGLQYRLNGVILPEGLSVFGQALSPRLADRVTLIDGALPAQYGLRTAGIIDITTKSGAQNSGSVSLYGGSHGEVEPSFDYAGSADATNLFVSGSFLTDKLGIESPDGRSNPLHDRTDQGQGFVYLDRILDPDNRISLAAGVSNDSFQIPNTPGQEPGLSFDPGSTPLKVDGQTTYPSADLNENQRESTEYAALSWLHSTDRFTGQISLVGRYSSLAFSPDPVGDLLYNGIAQTADKTDASIGLQAEGAYKLGDSHTVRAGMIVDVDRSISRTTSLVIPLASPTGPQTTDVPESIADNSSSTAETYSAYLQDEWKLASNLTLNYGLRFDQFDGYRDENQLSPRVNLVWLPFASTTVHAGYSRYFSPPPFELVGGETVSKFVNTTGEATIGADTTPYAERADYFDVGVEQSVSHALTVGIDGYYKRSTHLIDEGQFGAPIIQTPFNYQDGRQYGVELSTSYNKGPLTSYANVAWSVAQGRDIVSSQFNFDPAELAYIANHYIYLDHNQTWSGSLGASYLWRGTRIGGDLIYGSGLRSDLPLATPIATSAGPLDGIPNGASLGPYTQVNLSASHQFNTAPGGPYEVRVDLINALDVEYQIRNGTGVGVGAPQYGPRRGVFFGVTKDF